MSMSVNLVKVSPELLSEILIRPGLLDDMLFESKAGKVDGFDEDADVFGEDYRHMFVPYFEHLAEVAGEDPEEFDLCQVVREDPIYQAINPDEEINYDFCYGPATVHDQASVRKLAEKLGEGFSKADLKDEERMDVAHYLFFKQASEQGRAIICGIS